MINPTSATLKPQDIGESRPNTLDIDPASFLNLLGSFEHLRNQADSNSNGNGNSNSNSNGLLENNQGDFVTFPVNASPINLTPCPTVTISSLNAYYRASIPPTLGHEPNLKLSSLPPSAEIHSDASVSSLYESSPSLNILLNNTGKNSSVNKNDIMKSGTFDSITTDSVLPIQLQPAQQQPAIEKKETLPFLSNLNRGPVGPTALLTTHQQYDHATLQLIEKLSVMENVNFDDYTIVNIADNEKPTERQLPVINKFTQDTSWADELVITKDIGSATPNINYTSGPQVLWGSTTIESVVDLKWYATGKLSLLTKILQPDSNTSNYCLNVHGIPSRNNEPIQFGKLAAYEETADSTPIEMVSNNILYRTFRNSAADEKTLPRNSISNVISIGFPELAKRKVTAIDNDGAVDVVIRDYELSENDKKSLKAFLSDYYQGAGKTLNSLTLNGIFLS